MDSSRDARRRRILARGTDRLALISGQIRTLPSDAGSDLLQSGNHPRTASCPPAISQAQLSSFPSQTLDSPQSQDKESGSFLPNHDSVPATSQQFSDGDTVRRFIRNCDSMKPPEVSSFDPDGKGPSEVQNPPVSSFNKVHRREPLAHLRSLVPFNEVKSAIFASESTRRLCSVAVAILVVLASVGFPILGSRVVKSIIFFRPLYFLLLTNITIVIARVLEKQRGLQRPELQATGTPSDGEHDLADQLSSALDLGLFLLNVTGALFMDCSFYAITLICGLSLAQSLGW